MNITGYSEIAASVLNSGGTATVHSVYKNTVNLAFGSRIVSLQPAGSTQTPLSLMTDCPDLSFLRIQRGDTAAANQDLLQVAGKYDFHYGKQTSVIPTRLVVYRPLTSAECLRTAREISVVLTDKAPAESICHAVDDSPDPPISRIYLAEEHSVLEHAEAKYAEGDESSAAAELCGLIGLGPGLTPSGDDFLAGVLFALDTGLPAENSVFRQHLLQKIPEHLEMTTDLSGQFLRCAVGGHFAVPLLRLHEAATSEDMIMINEAIRKISSIGHSSGCDTLAGILWILKRFETQERIDIW